ncbi:MAG: hypothetical protein QXH87_04810 [Candidatus Bathyarchaeia archaeon]
MPRELVFRGKTDNPNRDVCSFCGKEFNVGEHVIRTSKRYYHASCFEKLLH